MWWEVYSGGSEFSTIGSVEAGEEGCMHLVRWERNQVQGKNCMGHVICSRTE